MGLFFMEQKENLLQISPVPHRSKFFNFLFQIVKWGNFAETLVYNTLCFTFASPEIQKNRVRPHCALGGLVIFLANGGTLSELKLRVLCHADSFVCCYLLNYAYSVFYSDQLKSKSSICSEACFFLLLILIELNI